MASHLFMAGGASGSRTQTLCCSNLECSKKDTSIKADLLAARGHKEE